MKILFVFSPSAKILAGTISETGSINHDSTTPDYTSEPTEELFETPASEILVSNDINDKNAEEMIVNDEQTTTVIDIYSESKME